MNYQNNNYMGKHIFNEKKFKQLYKEKHGSKIYQKDIAKFLGVKHPQHIQVMSYRKKGLNKVVTWLSDLADLVDCKIEDLIIRVDEKGQDI